MVIHWGEPHDRLFNHGENKLEPHWQNEPNAQHKHKQTPLS